MTPSPAPALALLALLLAPSPASGQAVLRETPGDTADDDFGRVLRRAAHDVDDDGLADLVVGAPRHSTERPGRVFVLSARTGDVLLEVAGAVPDDGFGLAADTVGDVDGDGTVDLVVGSPLDAEGEARAGALRLLSGADGAELLRLVGGAPFGRFGAAVCGLGDVDGDGRDDYVATEPGDPVHSEAPGYVMCLAGGEEGAALWFAEGAAADELFGESVARLPDLDGDGVPDLAVAAPRARVGGALTGRVVVVSGADGRVVLAVDGPAPGRFGSSLAHAGDVDGDGTPDLLVGDPGARVGGEPRGAAWVLSGADGAVIHTLRGRAAHGGFGAAVSGAGDVDGDGRDDVVLGAPHATDGGHDAGAVEVFSGRDGRSLLRVAGDVAGRGFGTAVCDLADLDEDGHADVVATGLPLRSPRLAPGVVRVVAGRAAPTPKPPPGDGDG